MKRNLIITMAVAMIFSFQTKASQIATDRIYSNILQSEVIYNVYLPNGYNPGQKTYPVVYLLHGLSDDYTAWMSRGNMAIVVDELIAANECDEMVIVMPNAGGPDIHNTWNGYFNMPGWNYEDFFFQELIPEVESKYMAGGSKGMRAVMGLSMGGGGSTVYCQHHPDMFSSCYAMSAWLDNDDSIISSNGTKDKLYYVCEAVHKNSALNFLAEADAETREQLRTVSWFFDCGDDDFLLDLSVRIHQMMQRLGIHSELRVRNGVHNWEYWHTALRTAMPYASRNFSR